jgi:hypothetical protein
MTGMELSIAGCESGQFSLVALSEGPYLAD